MQSEQVDCLRVLPLHCQLSTAAGNITFQPPESLPDPPESCMRTSSWGTACDPQRISQAQEQGNGSTEPDLQEHGSIQWHLYLFYRPHLLGGSSVAWDHGSQASSQLWHPLGYRLVGLERMLPVSADTPPGKPQPNLAPQEYFPGCVFQVAMCAAKTGPPQHWVMTIWACPF